MSRAIKKSRRSNQATRTIKAFNVCINPDPSATRGEIQGWGWGDKKIHQIPKSIFIANKFVLLNYLGEL
jgi:hypothetical protein